MARSTRTVCAFPLAVLLLVISHGSMAQLAPGREWVDKVYTYQDQEGNVVKWQNSFPKGGVGKAEQMGKVRGYTVFWSQVTNESGKAMELSIDLPEGRVRATPSVPSDIRIILPPETMRPDKVPMYDYGLTGLKTYIDQAYQGFGKLQKTIGPKSSYTFYVLVLYYYERQVTRAGFEMKGNNLFYKITDGKDAEPAVIPCGQIRFTNKL